MNTKRKEPEALAIHCKECDELFVPTANPETGIRHAYCERCAPVLDIKVTWQPMSRGSAVTQIYTLDEKGRPVGPKFHH